MRIAGVELNDNWKVGFALTRLKGIGWPHSDDILKKVKIGKLTKLSNLTNEEVAKISSELEKYTIEGDLIRKVRLDIQRLKDIGSLRGIRHNRGLPVRGQRTRSNARTKRGKRKTVGAFKKETLSKMDSTKKETK
ncbi:30S ribosomal protein S13 [Candidatus Woesebacteria bacterium]|nr:30S ribosomal protein S13 [Candidatus Woesebacteria bacterium]QQG47805.1 MAG: 30S ribosomal protein S13 [Candidatus Woesebacteria bacterium]